eukprot:3109879-Heterocapsa_arctica.AAC.1
MTNEVVVAYYKDHSDKQPALPPKRWRARDRTRSPSGKSAANTDGANVEMNSPQSAMNVSSGSDVSMKETAAAADPDAKIKDGDIIPDAPPALSLPPSLALSIDTVEHNQKYYLPREMDLGKYTVEKGGDVTLGSLTTRQCMMLRRFWDLSPEGPK